MQRQTELTVIELIEINPPETKTEVAINPTQTESAPRKPFLCRHIFVDGRRCGSRALRNQSFCYYHYAHRTPVLAVQRTREPVSGFDLTRLDGLDNHTAIQLSLSEVLSRIARNDIDTKRAGLLLYGLQIAGNNLRFSRPNPEAPVPDTIVEHESFGQLAPPEDGRPELPSTARHMKTLLEENPDADLVSIIEGPLHELLDSMQSRLPEVQT